jgi:predicted transcriptional regulator
MGIATAERILKILADRRPRSHTNLWKLSGVKIRAFTKARKKLVNSHLIVKGEGRNGLYTITDEGLAAYKARLLRMKRLPEMNFASRLVSFPWSRPPEIFDRHEDLNQLLDSYNIDLWMGEMVERLAKRKRLLRGNWLMDSASPDLPGDERYMYQEKDRFKRKISWFRKAHGFLFGIFLKFDGHEWERKIPWEKLERWANEKDRQFNQFLTKRSENDALAIETEKKVIRHETLREAASIDRRLDNMMKDQGQLPFCFKQEDVAGTLVVGLKDTVGSLIDEGRLKVKQATIYWLSLTAQGKAELPENQPHQTDAPTPSQILGNAMLET